MSVFQQERSFDQPQLYPREICEYEFIIFPYKTAKCHKTREWKLGKYGNVLRSILCNFQSVPSILSTSENSPLIPSTLNEEMQPALETSGRRSHPNRSITDYSAGANLLQIRSCWIPSSVLTPSASGLNSCALELLLCH